VLTFPRQFPAPSLTQHGRAKRAAGRRQDFADIEAIEKPAKSQQPKLSKKTQAPNRGALINETAAKPPRGFSGALELGAAFLGYTIREFRVWKNFMFCQDCGKQLRTPRDFVSLAEIRSVRLPTRQMWGPPAHRLAT
jgi:hypothetical protein